jgi:hypothetical protein
MEDISTMRALSVGCSATDGVLGLGELWFYWVREALLFLSRWIFRAAIFLVGGFKPHNKIAGLSPGYFISDLTPAGARHDAERL